MKNYGDLNFVNSAEAQFGTYSTGGYPLIMYGDTASDTIFLQRTITTPSASTTFEIIDIDTFNFTSSAAAVTNGYEIEFISPDASAAGVGGSFKFTFGDGYFGDIDGSLILSNPYRVDVDEAFFITQGQGSLYTGSLGFVNPSVNKNSSVPCTGVKALAVFGHDGTNYMESSLFSFDYLANKYLYIGGPGTSNKILFGPQVNWWSDSFTSGKTGATTAFLASSTVYFDGGTGYFQGISGYKSTVQTQTDFILKAGDAVTGAIEGGSLFLQQGAPGWGGAPTPERGVILVAYKPNDVTPYTIGFFGKDSSTTCPQSIAFGPCQPSGYTAATPNLGRTDNRWGTLYCKYDLEGNEVAIDLIGNIRFDNTYSGTIFGEDKASGTGTSLTIQAGGGGTGVGGILYLKGGSGASATGNVCIQSNTTNYLTLDADEFYPSETNTISLGISTSKRWSNIYTHMLDIKTQNDTHVPLAIQNASGISTFQIAGSGSNYNITAAAQSFTMSTTGDCTIQPGGSIGNNMTLIAGTTSSGDGGTLYLKGGVGVANGGNIVVQTGVQGTTTVSLKHYVTSVSKTVTWGNNCLYPGNSSYDLGATTNPWGDLHLVGDISAASMTLTGDATLKDLYLTGNCYVDSAMVISGTTQTWVGSGGVDTNGVVDGAGGFKINGASTVSNTNQFNGAGGVNTSASITSSGTYIAGTGSCYGSFAGGVQSGGTSTAFRKIRWETVSGLYISTSEFSVNWTRGSKVIVGISAIWFDNDAATYYVLPSHSHDTTAYYTGTAFKATNTADFLAADTVTFTVYYYIP